MGVKARKNVRLQAQLDDLLRIGAMPREGIVVKVGEPLPRHPDYGPDMARMAFLEASYKGGAAYKRARDAEGQPILVKHEQESAQAWERRRKLSACHNFTRPIIDKITGLVFTSPVTRDDSPALVEWSGDVDGQGTSLHAFMTRTCLMASVAGRWHVIIDTTKPSDDMTRSQAAAAGAGIILRPLHPMKVLDWRKEPRQMLVVDDSIGEHGGARLWDDVAFSEIWLDERGMVASVSPPVAHGWSSIPIVDVGPSSGRSLVEDVAELQASIFNMDSILKEELSKQTFTQWWLASSSVKPEDLQSVDVGSRKVLVLPVSPADVKFERLGGDPTQADSLRASILADVNEVYRTMGLKDPTTEQGPESGRALKIRFSETAYVAKSIADMAEDAESRITSLWSGAMETPVGDPSYPDEFDESNLVEELRMALDVVSADLPASVKAAQVAKYVNDAFEGEVPPEELKAMRQDVSGFYSDRLQE